MSAPKKVTPTSTQAYIINHSYHDMVNDFRNSLSGAMFSLLDAVLAEIGSTVFLSNACLIEDFREKSIVIDYQFEGFTTDEKRLELFFENDVAIKEIVQKWVDDDKHIDLPEWLERLSAHYPKSDSYREPNYRELAQSWFLNGEPHEYGNLLASAMVCEVLEVLSSDFMGYIEKMVDKNGVGEPRKDNACKEQVVLFLASCELAVASIGHCLVNHLGYNTFEHNSKLVVNGYKEAAKRGYLLKNDDDCAKFLNAHYLKIKSYFEFLGWESNVSLNQFLGQIHREGGLEEVTLQVLQEVMESNDTEHEDYGRVATILVGYINNDFSHRFIDFVEYRLDIPVLEISTAKKSAEKKVSESEARAVIMAVVDYYKNQGDRGIYNAIWAVAQSVGWSKFYLAATKPVERNIDNFFTDTNDEWFVDFFKSERKIINNWVRSKMLAGGLTYIGFYRNFISDDPKGDADFLAVFTDNNLKHENYQIIAKKVVMAMVHASVNVTEKYLTAKTLRDGIIKNGSATSEEIQTLLAYGFDTAKELSDYQKESDSKKSHQQSYDEGYAQAKADMMALFNKM